MTPIPVALVGAGVIGELHADVIGTSAEFQLAAVVDSGGEAGARLADRHASLGRPRPRTASRLEDVLDDVSAVVICTPSGAHAELATLAMTHGRHTMIEKPIDVSLDRARALEALAGAHPDLVTTVVSQHRYDPASEIVHRAVDGGIFGRMTSGVALLPWWRGSAYFASAGWRGTWAMDGGGALMNQGIHLLDLLVWMMGSVESVHAQARTLVHDIEVEDTLVATLTFASGAVGSLLATTSAYPQLPARLQVHGALGSAVIEDFELTYLHHSDSDKSGSRHDSQVGDDLAPEQLAAWGDDLDVSMGASHARQYADFATAIRTGSPMRVTIPDAVRSLEVISGIYRSASANGAVVELG